MGRVSLIQRCPKEIWVYMLRSMARNTNYIYVDAALIAS